MKELNKKEKKNKKYENKKSIYISQKKCIKNSKKKK